MVGRRFSPPRPARPLAAAAFVLAALAAAPQRASAQTYMADEAGWSLDRVGRDMVILRTPIATLQRGAPAGMVLFVCTPSASKMVVSFAQGSPLRSADVVSRGSATISVQESGGRKQSGDRQLMAGVNILASGSFEILDIPSETNNVVGALARFLASGARQITFSLFTDHAPDRFEQDRVVRLRFPENPDAERLPAEFQIACLQLRR